MRPGDERAAHDADRAARAEGWDKDVQDVDPEQALRDARAEMLRAERMDRTRNTRWARSGARARVARELVSGYGMAQWRVRFMGSGHDEFNDDFDGGFD